jgi:hypothetical protein
MVFAMKNNVEPDMLSQLDAVFAQLNPHTVEEFYVAYQQWTFRRRIAEQHQRIDAVREQQADNEQRMHQTQPSPIALAALARLQSNGVIDIALLDTMLERGEAWLDQTMQHLNYCEQFDDFISDDYTQWCQRALEGAFDWIDSMREATEQEASIPLEAPPEEASPDNEDAEEVEALLLQRLAIEDKQDDLSWQEITLKQTAIKLSPQETASDAPEEPVEPVGTTQQEAEIPEPEQPALIEFAPGEEDLHTEDEQPALVEFAAPSELSLAEEAIDHVPEQPVSTEIAIPQEIPTPEVEDTVQSEVKEPIEIENSASEEAAPHEEKTVSTSETITSARTVPRKRSVMQRLIEALFGK